MDELFNKIAIETMGMNDEQIWQYVFRNYPGIIDEVIEEEKSFLHKKPAYDAVINGVRYAQKNRP